MKTANQIDNVKEKILPVLAKYQVEKASIFGSFAQGRVREDSDLDILVQLNDQLSLFDFIGLKNDLEDTVGRKVDLVEFDTIKELLKEKILAEQVPIL